MQVGLFLVILESSSDEGDRRTFRDILFNAEPPNGDCEPAKKRQKGASTSVLGKIRNWMAACKGHSKPTSPPPLDAWAALVYLVGNSWLTIEMEITPSSQTVQALLAPDEVRSALVAKLFNADPRNSGIIIKRVSSIDKQSPRDQLCIDGPGALLVSGLTHTNPGYVNKITGMGLSTNPAPRSEHPHNLLNGYLKEPFQGSEP